MRRWVLAAVAVLVGLGAFVIGRAVDHEYYQISTDIAVQTWSVSLPGGYRVERQQSTPPRPDDGLRVFGKD